MAAISLANEAALSADELRRVVAYDPETGVMTWRVRSNNRYQAGSTVGWREDRYLRTAIRGRAYHVHRLIWLHVHGAWPAHFIDHINGITTDNRLANLRECTHVQNCANRRPKGTFKGVSLTSDKKAWQAEIRVGAKRIYIGRFKSAEEAHSAYAIRAREIFGEFARVN